MLRRTAGSEVEKISMYAVGFQTVGSIQDHATMPCLAHKPRTLTTANLTFLPPNSPSCTPWTSPRVKCHGTTRFSSRRPLRWQPSTPAGRLPGLLWSWPCRRTGSPSSTLYWVWYWLLCNRLWYANSNRLFSEAIPRYWMLISLLGVFCACVSASLHEELITIVLAILSILYLHFLWYALTKSHNPSLLQVSLWILRFLFIIALFI